LLNLFFEGLLLLLYKFNAKICSGDSYEGDGDVACDHYHKYKVSDPGV